MPRNWQIFARYPDGFGLRERDARPLVTIDGDQLEWSSVVANTIAAPAPPLAREHLLEILERSQFRRREFASWVLGCHGRTLDRYLAGEKIPEDRRNWISRLESVAAHGERVLIIVRAAPILVW